MVGAALVLRLPCLQNRDFYGVISDCRDIDSGCSPATERLPLTTLQWQTGSATVNIYVNL